MADVDCVRDYAWVHCLRCVYGRDASHDPGVQLETHARLYRDPVSARPTYYFLFLGAYLLTCTLDELLDHFSSAFKCISVPNLPVGT